MIRLSDKSKIWLSFFVAAIGYFVDAFDLQLFTVLRSASLTSLGYSGSDLLDVGAFLINTQLVGALIGGILWGIWGDKFGRTKVLFGSILIYSLATLANAFVHDFTGYVICRFLAGFGLAGEVGAGITILSEIFPKEKRGLIVSLMAAIGVSGPIFVSFLAKAVEWRTAYIVGGVMGLFILALRFGVYESGIFSKINKNKMVVKGSLKLLFSSQKRIKNFLLSIVIGIPIWMIATFFVIFIPEVSVSLNWPEISSADSMLFTSTAIVFGDIVAGILMHKLKNSKKIIFSFLILLLVYSFFLLSVPLGFLGEKQLLLLIIPIGFFCGFWGILLLSTSELFGSNLRATVTTMTPNFTRGFTVITTTLFVFLKTIFGIIVSIKILLVVFIGLALLATLLREETFGKDLDFVEK